MNIIEEKAEKLFLNNSHPIAFGILPDAQKIKLRLFKSYDNICYLKKGSHKKGYYLSGLNLLDIIELNHVSKKSESKKWSDAWNKVLSKLQKSGLWENIQSEVTIALEIGHEKMNLAYQKYWEINDENEKIAFLKTIDPRFIALNDKNEEYIISSLVWSYASLPKVKKMNFGKGSHNNYTLNSIKRSMENKKSFSAYGRTSYDVSFEYAPQKGNKAWYSEEFKGYGNGHYYVCLNETHCLFVEDD